MFRKKDVIYSETMGVCTVEDITKLTQKNGDTVMYYALRSVEDRDKNAYIPVENHTVKLRELIDRETAGELMNTCFEHKTKHEQFEIKYVLGEI